VCLSSWFVASWFVASWVCILVFLHLGLHLVVFNVQPANMSCNSPFLSSPHLVLS